MQNLWGASELAVQLLPRAAHVHGVMAPAWEICCGRVDADDDGAVDEEEGGRDTLAANRMVRVWDAVVDVPDGEG